MAPTDAQPCPDLPLRIRRIHGPYGIFTSSARRSVVFAGEIYLTAAHAITAAKVRDRALAARIRMAPSPREAMRLARPDAVRADWPQIGPDVIRRVHQARMIQHPGLAATLLATGQRELIVEDAVATGNTVGEALIHARDALAKPAGPAIEHAETMIPTVVRGWRWVLFGDHLVVAMRSCSVTMPAVAAFGLLRRTAEMTVHSRPESADVAGWRVPGCGIFLHHPDRPRPVSSTVLLHLLATTEVTHVHCPGINPVSPTAR
ncbi:MULTISPECIES: NADAR family protein [Catenuloplanes]|uniref:NAD-dependent protein-ADP-ribosyltransferase YbiA (DUF1768 family) n=1 Tax=Catenuloplanes niger TaxID=587534 RepID=A0AAE3ZPP6_9ACTN|nr:NADAR family protein [Catenuloplanes niger]MDR7322659.1 putative NAD-dependent protein-ADP-ribosyltransferase YbiA (DUF1768 family) [Catenuloplanes niger]